MSLSHSDFYLLILSFYNIKCIKETLEGRVMPALMLHAQCFSAEASRVSLNWDLAFIKIMSHWLQTETYWYLKLIQAWTLIGWDGSVLIPRYFMILTLLVKCQNDWNGVIVYSVQCIPGLILALFENVFNFLLSKCN